MTSLHTAIRFYIFTTCHGLIMIRRDLKDFPLAKCNNGSVGAYYHEQDARSAGENVLIYLPDGGNCNSVADCDKRCQEDKSLCSASKDSVIDKIGGIWSKNPEISPFANYFKVFIHYCSSDDLTGFGHVNSSSGSFVFHGTHILMSSLRDLVGRLGIDRAKSIVLAGSGSGALGVAHNCDQVSSQMQSLNPTTKVRCLMDGADWIPWWVGSKNCTARLLKRTELRHSFEEDTSTGKNKNKRIQSGFLSQYWQNIETPLLIVGTQLDPIYYQSSMCSPDVIEKNQDNTELSWKRGVVALTESLQARKPEKTSSFVSSCQGHTLLGDTLEEVYLTKVKVGKNALTLREVINMWLHGTNIHAVDSVNQHNSGCPVSAALKKGPAPTKQFARYSDGHSKVLVPPSSLFPQGYTRKCSLDPWYNHCEHKEDVFIIAAHQKTSQKERRRRLWQKVYTLQYLKRLFNKYRRAYTREYHEAEAEGHSTVLRKEASSTEIRDKLFPIIFKDKSGPTVVGAKRPSIFHRPRKVPKVVTIERPSIRLPSLPEALPSVPPPEYDYTLYDYGEDYVTRDYAEYYDYVDSRCNTDCALSKIIAALELRKEKLKKTEVDVEKPAKKNLLSKFKEFLSAQEGDYEDFGFDDGQVEAPSNKEARKEALL